MQIKGIIFDLDGTLLKNPGIPMFNKILSDTLKEFNINNLKKETMSQLWESGKNNKKILQSWGIKDYNKFWQIFDLNDYNKRREMINKKLIKPFEDISILPELKEKYELGVVSNSSKKIVNLEVDTFNLREYFKSIIILGTENQDYAKPEPHGLIWCVRELNLELNQCIYIGDLEVDLLAGKRAGLITFLIKRNSNKIKSFIKKVNILDSLFDLENRIKKL